MAMERGFSRVSAMLPNRGHAALLRSAVLAFAVAAAAVPSPGLACGQAAAEAAGRHNQKIRAESLKVRGVFTITQVESREIVEDEWTDGLGNPQRSTYTQRTIYGTVVSAKGKSFETVHEVSDLFLLCSATAKPAQDSTGTFYLSRRPGTDGRYDLIDYAGNPLPQISPQATDR
jgi:hypothetical protein